MAVDRDGLRIFDRDGCLELLRTRPLGRLAVTSRALPAILPVKYCLLGDDVVFTAGTGARSLALVEGQVVAFQADDIDAETCSGWSVLVVGIPRAVGPDHPDYEAVAGLPLRPWMGRAAAPYMRMSTEHMSGRGLPCRPAGLSAHGADPAVGV
ncbi:MAG TPA: pyridoxamine 5'-phosphate oxidase family protein [Acidimicrobiales bacterium]|nr:pyridoxamine 5'-phosphate oxidase family protein [Acidimicrobiales bacterium]